MFKAAIALLAVAAWGFVGSTGPVYAGPVVSEAYDERAASSGYFRSGDQALPGAYKIYLQSPQALGAYGGFGPRPRAIVRSSFAVDAHAGVYGYYPSRACVDCHADAVNNMHSARTTVTCRQCHRDQPIAGMFQYYSAMNPIRRHAYVCAKCHEGATANFSAYVVHEPPPLAAETAERFPALFYTTWFMVILAGGVFLFFLPYTAAWGARELWQRVFAKEAK